MIFLLKWGRFGVLFDDVANTFSGYFVSVIEKIFGILLMQNLSCNLPQRDKNNCLVEFGFKYQWTLNIERDV